MGAKLFTGTNAFCSNVYAKPAEESAPGPGEISRSYPWDAGVNPGYAGVCTCGQLDWFATGQLPASILTPPTPAYLDCCAPFTPCTSCAGGQGPKRFRLTATGGTADFAAANGIYLLDYALTQCVWVYHVDLNTSWFLIVGQPNNTINWTNAPSTLASYTQSPRAWTCLTPAADFELSSSQGSGTPPVISIAPYLGP